MAEGLDKIHAYFREQLQQPWTIISDCAAHMHPLILADTRRRWESMLSEDLRGFRISMLLALIGIPRRTFQSEEQMRSDALAVRMIVMNRWIAHRYQLLEIAKQDPDDVVRSFAYLLRNWPRIPVDAEDSTAGTLDLNLEDKMPQIRELLDEMKEKST